MTIAHVDCTAGDNANRELCNSNGVNGFPTLNIYKDGVKVSDGLLSPPLSTLIEGGGV